MRKSVIAGALSAATRRRPRSFHRVRPRPPTPPYDVLVFSKTAGFRHDAIPVGIQTIQALGGANNFTVTATENAALFATANLAQYEAVIFLNTTGDVLNAAQQTAFEAGIGSGGGYVGVHAAADTEYSWPFYGNLVGAWFPLHPAQQNATVVFEDRTHSRHHRPALERHPVRRVVQLPDQPTIVGRVLALANESSLLRRHDER